MYVKSMFSLSYWLGKIIYHIACKITAVSAGLKERQFITSQGNLKYFINSIPERPMLVFLHGFSGNKEIWLNTVWWLRHTYSLLIPDLPGHGGTDNPANGDYSANAHARILNELLVAEGINDCYLIGSSMGCAVSASILCNSTIRIQGSLFINPFGVTSDQISAIEHFRPTTSAPFKLSDIDDYNKFFNTICWRPLWIPGWVKYYLAVKHIDRNHHISEMFEALKCYEAFLPRLQQLQQQHPFSLVILAGEHDAVVTTKCFSELEQSLEGCSLYWLDDCGHLPMLEVPKKLATAIRNHLVCYKTNGVVTV